MCPRREQTNEEERKVEDRPMARFLRTGLAVTAAAIAAAPMMARQDAALKDLMPKGMVIGVAMNQRQSDGADAAAVDIITKQFNQVTPENLLKFQSVHPAADRYTFDAQDRYVQFGVDRKMQVVGHTLVWHNQTGTWVFQGPEGKPADRETLLARMRDHIRTVVGRYKGKIHGWDVVNEAIDEDEKGWRQSPFFTIVGPEFMERAFRWAHEADPQATLLYNDYNEHNPGRRAFLVGILRDYRTRGVPIHGVGFQGHVGLEYPDLTEYEKSIEAIAGEGLPIHVTELDVDVLPRASGYTGAEISTNIALSEQLNPWKAGLPPEIDAKLTARYRELFTLFLKHRRSIARVTTWGAFDGESWKNNFPVRGRTNYPLLFDRQLQPKAAYAGIVALKK
jgi:endo-1,4-beta-xylanase